MALNLLVCLPFLFLSLATASSDFLHSVVKMMITPVLMNRLTTIENSLILKFLETMLVGRCSHASLTLSLALRYAFQSLHGCHLKNY